MLTNLAFFHAMPGQTKLLKALTDLVDPTRQEAGYISYDVHQSLQGLEEHLVAAQWFFNIAVVRHPLLQYNRLGGRPLRACDGVTWWVV
jgi:quinol monooxygenase YgiN